MTATLDLIRFYAAELADTRTAGLVSQGTIVTEAAARRVPAFRDRMLDLALQFEKQGRVAPGGPMKAYDAEKLHGLLSDLVAEQGF